jgi:hypothetical protein
MQNALRSITDALATFPDSGLDVPRAELATSRVRVKASKEPFGINELFIAIRTEKDSYGALFNDSKKVIESGSIKVESPTLYDTRRYKISEKEYPKIKELNQIVSLKGKDMYMENVLKYLHETKGISCVTEVKQFINQRVDIDIPAMPLWKFMDTITKLYKDTEWEYRKSGVIIVRGPMNSARGQSRNPITTMILDKSK